MNESLIRPSICRTCLKTHKNFVNIFEHLKNDRSISEILTECTTVKVESNDGLPTNICNICFDKLNAAYDFKSMTIESDRKLQTVHHDTEDTPNVNVKIEDDILFDLCKDNDKNDDEMIKLEEMETMEMDSNQIKREDCVNVKDNNEDSTSIDIADTNIPTNNDDMQDDLFEYEKSEGQIVEGKKQLRVHCKVCNKMYKHKYYFSTHIHMHLNHLPHKCELCDRRFVQSYLLKEHMKIHKDDTPYTCEICGKCFKLRASLSMHKDVHNKSHYKCPVCDKTFKHRSSLQSHSKSHTDGKRVCELCGKPFDNISDLKKHLVTHNTEYNFKCNVCGKLFKTKRRQTVHMNLHTEDRPFVCSYCNKAFKVKMVLDKHILIHTGGKPYSCKLCGKSFRQNNCIARHMRTHTGEAPFSCELCLTKFKYSHQLKIHNVKVHQKEKDN